MKSKWFQLRARRKQSLRHIKKLLMQHGLDDAVISGGIWSCNMCHEYTYRICKTYERTSLSGERFQFTSPPSAYACLRCACISKMRDCSGTKDGIDTVTVERLTELLKDEARW